MRFRDREDAGRRLAVTVRAAGIGGDGIVVLGLPRGGVPVAAEVARALDAPLDVIVVRKLGVPFQPELAMGAIGEGGVRVENQDVTHGQGHGSLDFGSVERAERAELVRRAFRYRGDNARVELAGRGAVIVDDGIATGSSARAACRVARAQRAARIVLATPVASTVALGALRDECDQILCLSAPDPFFAVGEWYDDFRPTTDAEVVRLLEDAASRIRHAGEG